MKISKEVYDALEEWKCDIGTYNSTYDELEFFFDDYDIEQFPTIVHDWWVGNAVSRSQEQNNRLIAIIRWVNGEDVFEVDND